VPRVSRGSGGSGIRPALRTATRQPPEIVRGPGITLYGQIEDWLAGEIATGALVPGDRLPTEHDLAEWFGVSRMTLRHALAELARRGLVTRTTGRRGGTFVAAPKLEQDLTTLAGFSEQLRRVGMVAGARVLSARLRPAGPAAGAALLLPEAGQVYEIRRTRLDGSLYELLEVRYGLRPHRARESLEPVTAGVREAEALEVAEGAPLMLVERTAYARSGEPLEFARDLFRGDRTRVVVWTSELAGDI
jgi:GntR family transcriptional regulator